MSDLITLIHRETDTRRFQRTPCRGREAEAARSAPPVGHPAPGTTYQPSHCIVDSPPPPRLHIRRSLSWFDPRAHIGRSGLYISAPSPLRRHKSFEKTETLIILRAPPYSRAQLVRLGLEGGKQASLGFPIVSRVWFGIIFVPSFFCTSITFICQLQLL